MYINVTETGFKDQFRAMGRLDNFSHEGLSALYEWFEALESETDQAMELDVIAICCDFSEEPIKQVLDNYGLESINELHDNTLVVAVFGDTVLYQVY